MKHLLLTTIAIMTLSTFKAFASDEAFAAGADQMTEVLRCQPAQARPDAGMSVSLTTGGIAGLTQVRVTRFFLGHSTVENYIVHAIPTNPRQLGAATSYVGEGIRLTVNFTTRLPNGKQYGTLQLGNQADSSIEALGCDLIAQNPQVNYTF